MDTFLNMTMGSLTFGLKLFEMNEKKFYKDVPGCLIDKNE